MKTKRRPTNVNEIARRIFLETSAAVWVAALGGVDLSRSAYAAGADTIRIGIVDCGGRGTGAAIRSGNPINNGDSMARSTLIAVMGQIRCYAGSEITWDQAAKSDFYFRPKPEQRTFDMEPPTKPEANGVYPVPVPCVSKMM